MPTWTSLSLLALAACLGLSLAALAASVSDDGPRWVWMVTLSAAAVSAGAVLALYGRGRVPPRRPPNSPPGGSPGARTR
jgi:hypothetical protein